MFINFWYPAEEAENITDTPLKVQMLGLWFVLWRDEDGRARCVANTCTHRGGSLGDGKVVGNQAQWIIGGDSSQKEPLKAEDSQTFKVAISTTSKPTTAKVTFSKIILEDGPKVNPHKSLVTKSK